MASPLAEGLFQKAIMESSVFWDSEDGSITTFSQARDVGKAFQKQKNIKIKIKMKSSSLEKLRAISA